MRAAEERAYAQLFEASPFPAVLSRLKDGTVIAINERTAEVIGVAPADAVGQLVTTYYVDPSQRDRIAALIASQGRADDLRLEIMRRNREPLWVLASFRLVTWKGEPAVLTVFHDLSGQVAAEASLKAGERRLVAQSDALTTLTTRYTHAIDRFDDRLLGILEIAAVALQVERLSMWQFEGDGARIRCAGLYRRTGKQFDVGATIERPSAPEYFAALARERVIAATDACTDPRTREFAETYLAPHGIGAMLDVPLRHDNRTVGVLCAEHVGPPRVWEVDEQNFALSVANLIVIALAAEDRRVAIARLADSEARARLIVDTAHDAYIGMDSRGGITAWNTQAERTFGWTREEAVGRNLADTIIPTAFRDAHNAGMRGFHETGEAPVVNQRLELTALHRSGREFPIELTISSPMPEQGGFFFGAFLRDISERKLRHAELRQARDSAEAATRAKSEFLANMSHELRTPLNGVLGYAQILQRDRSLGATQREALDAISKCGSQLLDLINDVLDLSKIEAGRLDIETAPADLSRLISDVTYVVAESATRKGLQLVTSVADDVPPWLVLDSRHLRQVLLNLLGNAIKFTASGTVALAITRAGEKQVAFEVRDTGPGIEPEALTEIFAAFSQTRSGAAAGGTGLGLTISDHLIARMGGTLRVDSVLGEGSRFHFQLPLVAAREPASRGDADGTLPPLDARLVPGQQVTALVVDDSTANRRILAGLLESAGVTVLTASGGLQGVELARTRRPDIVLMDLKMNDLDGLEATRRLAADPHTAKIPVVAVTASALGDIQQTARDAGCVDYLAKPIRAQALFAMLQLHTGVRFVGSPASAGAGGPRELDPARRIQLATRLRDAVGIGDIGDIQQLAQGLIGGDPAEAAIGERVHRLAANFDFDGLRGLADSLAVGS